MKKKEHLPNIKSLSEVILETVKEITRSGNVLNPAILSQYLAKKPLFKDFLKRITEHEKKEGKTTEAPKTKKLESQLKSLEKKRQKSLNTITELENQHERERDFNKRFSFLLLNICKIYGDEVFLNKIDQCKQLLIDDTDIKSREELLHTLNNMLLKTDSVLKRKTDVPDETAGKKQRKKQTVFGKFFHNYNAVKIEDIKLSVVKTLDDLLDVLGKEFEDSILNLRERVEKSEDVDYLFSLRKQAIGIIIEYNQHVQKGKEDVAGFLNDVAKILDEMGKELQDSFSYNSKNMKKDYKFSEKLSVDIADIGQSVEKSKDLQEVKLLITQELSKLSKTIDRKRWEFAARSKKVDSEKEKLQKHFESIIDNITEKNELLYEQSQKDPLTGIFNRRSLEEMFALELHRFQRYNASFCLLMFDIDQFKIVNDNYGHDAGDKVLNGIVKSVIDILRETDIFARFGGDEFVVLLVETDLDHGIKVAQKLHQTVQKTEFIYEGRKVPVTISIGITEIKPDDTDINSIYNRVDTYMYRAKRRGGDGIATDLNK